MLHPTRLLFHRGVIAVSLILVTCILVGIFYYFPVYLARDIDTASIKQWGGYAYVTPVPEMFPGNESINNLLADLADSNATPSASSLQLLEDGRPLGLAHSVHADIAKTGGGKFSHWVDYIVFSAPDNSNLLSNGRTYSVLYRIPPLWWGTPLLLIASASGLYLFISIYRKFNKKLDNLLLSVSGLLPWHRLIPQTREAFFLFAGSVLIILPIVLVHFWPYAKSPYMPEDVSRYPNSYFLPKAKRISSWDDSRLMRRDGEEDFKFIGRMLNVVHNATYHCDEHDYSQSWFTWLTWKLGIFSLIPGNINGVLDVKTFRCGFCGQRAFILARALRNGGINSAEVLGLLGHVITVVTYGGELYAVDPDYGVGPVKITGLDSASNSMGSTNYEEIKKGLLAAYSPLIEPFSNDFIQKNVIDVYLSTKDNKYSNYERLDRVRHAQSILFSFEKIIEYIMFLTGFIMISYGIYLRQKYKSIYLK